MTTIEKITIEILFFVCMRERFLIKSNIDSTARRMQTQKLRLFEVGRDLIVQKPYLVIGLEGNEIIFQETHIFLFCLLKL